MLTALAGSSLSSALASDAMKVIDVLLSLPVLLLLKLLWPLASASLHLELLKDRGTQHVEYKIYAVYAALRLYEYYPRGTSPGSSSTRKIQLFSTSLVQETGGSE